jgi:2-keto-4-pentenoate hydratase
VGVTLAGTEQINGTKVPLKTWEARQIAERMLADGDAHRPNEIFAERGTDWLTLDDAYIIQRAVADLRVARGERCIGYKVGCLSTPIQEQLGLHQPVRGYLWQTEVLVSGSHVLYESRGDCRASRFVNLAIEGEIALRLGRDISPETAEESSISDCIQCWFPVIELHNAVFRGPTPTSQELVAGNAMHAGFVVPSNSEISCLTALVEAQIRVEIDGKLVETKRVAELPGGPLGSLSRLASLHLPGRETLKAGDIVLTGSPGRLIPIEGSCTISVICEGQRVDLLVQAGQAEKGS